MILLAFSLGLATGALAWAGIVLGPAVAAVLMSASTVIAALNAQFLRRLDLKGPPWVLTPVSAHTITRPR